MGDRPVVARETLLIEYTTYEDGGASLGVHGTNLDDTILSPAAKVGLCELGASHVRTSLVAASHAAKFKREVEGGV